MQETIIKFLQEQGFNTKPVTKNRIAVLVDGFAQSVRQDILFKIQNLFDVDVEYDPSPKHSSIGHLHIVSADQSIVVKPNSYHGDVSFGVSNENILFNTLKKHLKRNKGLDVIFVGANGKDHCFQKIYDVWKPEKEKSDICLIDSDKNSYGVSIKKQNFQHWGSADASLTNFFEKHVQQLIQKKELIRSGEIWRLKSEFFFPVSTEIGKEICFGDTDLIVKQTFNEKDFLQYQNKILIRCSSVYSEYQDLLGTPDAPHILFRNDCSRKPSHGYHGIRTVIVCKSRIRSHTKTL